MKTSLFKGILLATALITGCSTFTPPDPWNTQGNAPEEARAEAKRITKQTGEAHLPDGSVPERSNERPSFSTMSLSELWTQIERSKQLAVVALRDEKVARGFFRGRNLLSSAKFEQLASALYRVPGISSPNQHAPTQDLKMPVMSDGQAYPAVVVHLEDETTLRRIRSLSFVDFVEPLYMEVMLMQLGGIAGCGIPPYNGNPNDTIFGGRPGGVSGRGVIPWSYAHHNIIKAWGLFRPPEEAPGAPNGVDENGVTLFILDTGLYPTQTQFRQPQFSASHPANRRSIREVNYFGSSGVSCSHGTRIAGLAAAPADSSSRETVAGIAWGSSVQISKVGEGVFHLNSTVTFVTQLGLANSIRDAADANWPLAVGKRNKRVLLMAWGFLQEALLVKDAIVDVYDNYEDLIMIAAAGTFWPKVVFPAWMEREIVTVSLVDAYKSHIPQNSDAIYRTYDPWIHGFENIVAYGKEVDFVAVNGPTDIPTTGNGIDESGNSTDKDGVVKPASAIETVRETTTIGGSSSAVATIGGSIALIWSRMPDLTRDGVLARLALASSCANISGLPLEQSTACLRHIKDRDVGWGVPNIYYAAGGARRTWIEGSTGIEKPGVPFTLTAQVDGALPLFDFTWSDGVVGQSRSVTMASGGRRSFAISAFNRNDGSTLRSENFEIVSSGGFHERWLYATSAPVSSSTFLDGQKIDVPVNIGVRLPPGCWIKEAFGQDLTVGGPNPGSPAGFPTPTLNRGNHGFSIARVDKAHPRDLGVIVHAWHNGASAVRVRPAYLIQEADGIDCKVSLTQTTPFGAGTGGPTGGGPSGPRMCPASSPHCCERDEEGGQCRSCRPKKASCK